MSGRQHKRSTEVLSRLLMLDLGELRELWCQLYKTEAAPRLSRKLLVRAVAYRIQEVVSAEPILSRVTGSTSVTFSHDILRHEPEREKRKF